MDMAIRKEFTYTKVDKSQEILMNMMREKCTDILNFLEENLEETRYQSICKTKLEELSMFANKAICLTCKQIL